MKRPTALCLFAASCLLVPSLGAAESQPEVNIAPERLRLIGVTYEQVEKTPLRAHVRAVGSVAVPADADWSIVSHVDGYVLSLGVVSPGERVAAGQEVARIYSPDLLATEREFSQLIEAGKQAAATGRPEAAQSDAKLAGSARERLQLWGVPGTTIQALEQGGTPDMATPFAANRGGVVAEVKVRSGQKVQAGDTLVRLIDLSRVWVWAEFYQEDLPLLKSGSTVRITSTAMPGLEATGCIAVVDPAMDRDRRTVKVRVDLANPGGQLRQDLYVDVDLEVDQGEGLTVSTASVLPTGRGNLVFVEKAEGRLEPRYVQIGRRYGKRIAVTSGLSEHERVVSSANFLIDSESSLQGALKSW